MTTEAPTANLTAQAQGISKQAKTARKNAGKTDHPDAAMIQPYAIQASTTRTVTIIALAEAIAIVALVFGIVSMLPLKSIRPVYVGFDNVDARTVTIYPEEGFLPDRRTLAEAQAQDYVIQRESISSIGDANNDRIGFVQLMSDQSVYTAYRNFQESDEGPIKQAVQRNWTRSIEIESVSHATLAEDVVTVNFTMEDRKEVTGELLNSRTFQANVQYTFEPSRVPPQNPYFNPVGFTVVNYSLAPRDTVQ